MQAHWTTSYPSDVDCAFLDFAVLEAHGLRHIVTIDRGNEFSLLDVVVDSVLCINVPI